MTAAFDIDKDYPAQEQPNEFAIRWQQVNADGIRIGLTEDERAKLEGVKSCSEAFAILYPSFQSLDDYRVQKLRELAAAKAEQEQPE